MSAIEQILNEDILTAFFQKGSEIAFKNGNLQIVDEEFYEILNGFTLQILYDLRMLIEDPLKEIHSWFQEVVVRGGIFDKMSIRQICYKYRLWVHLSKLYLFANLLNPMDAEVCLKSKSETEEDIKMKQDYTEPINSMKNYKDKILTLLKEVKVFRSKVLLIFEDANVRNSVKEYIDHNQESDESGCSGALRWFEVLFGYSLYSEEPSAQRGMLSEVYEDCRDLLQSWRQANHRINSKIKHLAKEAANAKKQQLVIVHKLLQENFG